MFFAAQSLHAAPAADVQQLAGDPSEPDLKQTARWRRRDPPAYLSRPEGMVGTTCRSSSGVIHPVWVGPGTMMLAVIPNLANSQAAERV